MPVKQVQAGTATAPRTTGSGGRRRCSRATVVVVVVAVVVAMVTIVLAIPLATNHHCPAVVVLAANTWHAIAGTELATRV